jgi:hypothetical protein
MRIGPDIQGGTAMKYEELKKEIKEIADIANSVPEAFQPQCFEILLRHLLGAASNESSRGGTATVLENKKHKDTPDGDASHRTGHHASPLPTPSQIKVFMQKTGLTLDDLQRVVMFEDGEIHFLKEPTTHTIARGQIEWALLIALKNGFTENSLSVDPENTRSICQEKGFYDQANFLKNFKSPKAAALFQGPMEAQGEPQKLTNDGQKELSQLVKALGNVAP